MSHFLSSLPSSLVELAPKFPSWSHLIHSSSRQLKALGLSVVQRKQLLYHCELYRARARRREMLQLLAQPATRQQSAVAVQQALYDIAYAHVYARQWKRAEEAEAQHWWRQATEMNRLRKSFIRNQWNGVQVQTNPESMKPLRNPEMMKARLQQEIDNLREMEADGTASLFDRLELLEHEQLMDENERPDLSDEVDDMVEEMGEDDELREDIKQALSRQRQERLLDTDADREAREAAEHSEALQRQQTREELSTALRGEDELEAAAGEEAEEEEDEEAAFDALSQAEQDAANPHMEEGMNEEQKEDARLELAVDRTIGSAAVRHAVQMEVELTLLDSDRDDFAEEAAAEDDDALEAAEGEEAAADGSDGADGERASRPGASGVTAPDVPDASAAAGEANEAAAESQSEPDRAAVSRRVQARQREAATLSKLFSYNGSKPEQ